MLGIARKAHEKSQMSVMFFEPKIYALIQIPASETSRPRTTYVSHARPCDFVAQNYVLASLEGDK